MQYYFSLGWKKKTHWQRYSQHHLCWWRQVRNLETAFLKKTKLKVFIFQRSNGQIPTGVYQVTIYPCLCCGVFRGMWLLDIYLFNSISIFFRMMSTISHCIQRKVFLYLDHLCQDRGSQITWLSGKFLSAFKLQQLQFSKDI